MHDDYMVGSMPKLRAAASSSEAKHRWEPYSVSGSGMPSQYHSAHGQQLTQDPRTEKRDPLSSAAPQGYRRAAKASRLRNPRADFRNS